jgi:hypothetical protein
MRPLFTGFAWALLLGASSLLHAQAGVYGKFDFVRDNDLTYPGNSGSNVTMYGFGLGVYDDFAHAGPIHAGFDFRYNYASGDSYAYRAILAGVRVSAKLPGLSARPYVQVSAGDGGPKYTGPTAAEITNVPYSNKFLYEILGGIDCAVLPHVDWRVIEAGVGRQTGESSSSSAPQSTLALVSSGVVLRF